MKADLGTEKDTFDLVTGQLTDPNTPPDETETINESNSISYVPTSTTQSPAIRRTHIRNTYQPRSRNHQSNATKDDFINMMQISMM